MKKKKVNLPGLNEAQGFAANPTPAAKSAPSTPPTMPKPVAPPAPMTMPPGMGEGPMMVNKVGGAIKKAKMKGK